jgi:hypothetical protein
VIFKNPVTNEVKLYDPKESGDEYLLDLVAVKTYLKGGTVFAVKPEKVPGGTPVIAILRY